ncbi:MULTISPECIES: hypothetical protein [Streptosporangium]|uniref:Sugar phosphate isomerase/epimerase n=1 Tax=Streptosporangium brasiliense TaxID=47480 RepID=A0ABT9RCR0_9ACTN|nr:hypothetical protein [Streptosporangium brasiliense]MDP9866933.1 sugar phosphate isomerase/epimerase [Streptosporangium brasiliense]
MDTEDLTRFSELSHAASEQRPLELAELHEIGGLLSAVIQAAATLAGHMGAEVITLTTRYTLRDDTRDPDPEARLAEVRQRMEWMTDFLEKADRHAHRAHTAIGHIVEAD